MKTLKATAIITVLLLALNAQGQTLLTSTELLHIYQLNDSSINTMLTQKGYVAAYKQTVDGKQFSSWKFQITPSEAGDLQVLKTTSSKKPEVRYWITNPFFFKQFMDSTVKDGYKYIDIKIVTGMCFFVYKNGNKQFLVSHQLNADLNSFYYEIIHFIN